MTTSPAIKAARSAGLGRRLAALFYDSLLLFGIVCVATLALLPFTGGRAIAPGTLWYQAYLLALIFLFYGWCWTHGGQTLGMKAWRIRVQRRGGGRLGWWQALLRWASATLSWAAFGLGYLWLWFDRDRRTWHDYLSATEVVIVD